MDTVLGLSMTPTSLGVVVVDGDGAPGGANGQESFEVRVDGADSRAATERATAAVGAIAAARGQRLTSIGVTWSEDADAEASELISSLNRSGFDNVVPIRLPEATEALARGMAEVIGYQTSAVCVIEPDTAIALIVNTSDGAVQTAINHGIDSDESLIGWLSTVFTRADWQPEALVVVGSAGGFDAVLPQLEEALSVPVFAPAEAPLALARGAALASFPSAGLPFAFDAPTGGSGRHAAAERRFDTPRVLTGLLVAGVVTFVASVSAAVAVQTSPRQETAAPEPAAVVADVPVRPAPRPAAPAPAPERSPLAEALAPPVEFAPLPQAPVEPALPQAPVEPAAPQAPIQEVNTVYEPAPAQAPLPEPALAPAPPLAVAPPAVVSPPVPPVATPPQVFEPPKKPLLQRIRDRLRIGGPEQGPPGQIVVSPPQG
ncbi:DUF7159 family protein [Mycobacterium sp. NPDC003323]